MSLSNEEMASSGWHRVSTIFFQREERRDKCAGRLFIVGFLYHCSFSYSFPDTPVAAWDPPRHSTHEKHCMQLCLVARIRWWTEKSSQHLPKLSSIPTVTTEISTSPMGLARKSVVQSQYWFHRSIFGVAQSKLLEVHPLNFPSSHAALSKLRRVFFIFGLPDVLVSDNARAFTSKEFQQFVKCNGISHVTLSPHHPITNGLVERAVQSFKQVMRKSTSPLNITLHNFLFSYHLIPHSTKVKHL